MFKFIHCADIHLDSPLIGLDRYEGAPVDEIRLATRRAFENMVALALDEQVDFVVIAGDLFDGDWRDFNTGLFLTGQLARLNESDIPVVMIAGNHDAEGKMTRALKWPANVRLLASDQAETVALDSAPVAIHGQSFATAAVTSNLAQSYPAARSGVFNIGLLHTCATGRQGHAPYAPCTISDLQAKQYDYWALGHVHTREVLSEDPPIVFPGNTQGRNIRETGARGCMLVSVDDQEKVTMRFEPTDVFRWEHCQVDLSGAMTSDDVLERFTKQSDRLLAASDGRPLALRVAFTGETAVDADLKQDTVKWTNQVRSSAIDCGRGEIWVEKVKFATSAPATGTDIGDGDTAFLHTMDGPLGEIAALVRELRARPESLHELAVDVNDLKSKLPSEITSGPDGLRLDDSDWTARFLDEVEQMLLHRLVSGVRPR